MDIGIVGANGFLGSYLAGHVARRDHRVVPILRGAPLPNRHLDLVIDCNGDPRRFWAEENPNDSFRTSVASVVDRLHGLRFDRYIFISTIDVYGAGCGDEARTHEQAAVDPGGMCTYAFHKFLAEQAVGWAARHSLILRLGTLIGPSLKKNPVFDAINGLPIRQTPDSTLTLVDLARVAQALDTLLNRDADGIYNVTGRATVSVADMLALVAGETPGIGPEEEFTYGDELLRTRYQISVGKISGLMEMPTSLDMLRDYLAQTVTGC